jgi:hypothetical protein
MSEMKRAALGAAGKVLLKPALGALCRTLKVEPINEEPATRLREKGEPFALAFWHGTMLYAWRRHRRQGMTGLTSQSKDGDVLARLLTAWGYRVARGSSSKGGSEALDSMTRALLSGSSIAVTPDGPRGPARRMKPGVVVAAKRANVPVVLMGVGYEKKRTLGGWDRFEIPKFFSRVRLVYSDPIAIEPDADRARVNEIIMACEKELNRLQTAAEAFAR